MFAEPWPTAAGVNVFSYTVHAAQLTSNASSNVTITAIPLTIGARRLLRGVVASMQIMIPRKTRARDQEDILKSSR